MKIRYAHYLYVNRTTSVSTTTMYRIGDRSDERCDKGFSILPVLGEVPSEAHRKLKLQRVREARGAPLALQPHLSVGAELNLDVP